MAPGRQTRPNPLVVAFASSKESSSDPFLESIGISVVPISTDFKSLTPQICADSITFPYVCQRITKPYRICVNLNQQILFVRHSFPEPLKRQVLDD